MRKKISLPPPKVIIPQKREEPLLNDNDEEQIEPKLERRKKTFKTIKIGINATKEDKKHIYEKLIKGDISYGYFTIDGDVGYIHYFINN